MSVHGAYWLCISRLKYADSSFDGMPRPNKTSISTEKRDDIPWPALAKFSRGNLTRTASSMMNELEKSLAPQTRDVADPPSKTASKDQKAD